MTTVCTNYYAQKRYHFHQLLRAKTLPFSRIITRKNATIFKDYYTQNATIFNDYYTQKRYHFQLPEKVQLAVTGEDASVGQAELPQQELERWGESRVTDVVVKKEAEEVVVEEEEEEVVVVMPPAGLASAAALHSSPRFSPFPPHEKGVSLLT
jgi:hypothetical protein